MDSPHSAADAGAAASHNKTHPPVGGSGDEGLGCQTLSIPTYSAESVPVNLRCCCGRQDCALLEHNAVALEGLEKDLATAARLGQVREAIC